MRRPRGGTPVAGHERLRDRRFIKLDNGFTIYHMGDTNLFSDMKLIGEYFKPDLLLVPIGGHFVMDPKEAALATKLVHVMNPGETQVV